ncbi:hypothetical protein BCR42DRAFT_426050 [Absidia repens]|uniref:Uncharacterized protein n=1 Tax=Absidia repens TaxID=90262 RepID=A0A1X2I284_9FUNG|nr:hypothetical protein BCR42DRAFT_426050 [Absidia repens]
MGVFLCYRKTGRGRHTISNIIEDTSTSFFLGVDFSVVEFTCLQFLIGVVGVFDFAVHMECLTSYIKSASKSTIFIIFIPIGVVVARPVQSFKNRDDNFHAISNARAVKVPPPSTLECHPSNFGHHVISTSMRPSISSIREYRVHAPQC